MYIKEFYFRAFPLSLLDQLSSINEVRALGQVYEHIFVTEPT